MSGPFGSPQWMYSSGDFYPHEIDNSVRFDSNSQLSRTPSSTGDMRTWTFSAWVKRSKLSDSNYDGIFSAGTGGVNRDVLFFESNDRLSYNGYTSSAYDWIYTSSQRFRDPAAWYHIVVVQDTGQETASNRIKIYVNGEQITDWYESSDPNRYKQGYVNNTNEHTIGSTPYDTTYFDGYITEVNFVDGTALTPASFGETKADTWVPKEYEGSYGSLGYYLKFGNSSSLGTDSSGNGNTWTVTNIVATDQVPDSPTNNFATLNPIGPRRNGANYGSGAQTQGNLTITSTSNSYFDDTEATVFNNGDTGKWYYEMRLDENHGNGGVGYEQFNIGGYYLAEFYTPAALIVTNTGTTTLSPSSFSNGDIFMFAVDQDNGKGWFGKNGTWYTISGGGTPNPATGANAATTFTSIDRIGQVQLRSSTSSLHRTVTANFGQDSSFAGQATAQGNTDANGIGDFYYAPPAGFLALCTANLPDPAAAFNPAVNNSPQDHFNTVLYSGNDSTNNITGVGFQPDWVWLKARSSGKSWRSFDAVRGATKDLSINHESAEYTDSVSLTSFDSDGFTLGDDDGGCNGSGITYASWNWKANGAGSSNSDGTISATVSVNTDIGLSIVKYNGSSAGTVGHGLSSAPHIVIQKSLSTGSTYWWTGTTVIDGSLDFVRLNDVTVKADSSYSVPTSSVFSNVTFTGSTSNIAYCLHSVEGFSKVGIYTGNGSADGPFINCGFKPAFILIKNINTTDYWTLIDNKRVGYNETNSIVSTNYLSAEYAASGGGFDIVSSGFKVRGTSTNFNGNTNTMVYIAFAEMPFKYANAR